MLQKYMQKLSKLFSSIPKYLLAAVIIIVPLYPKFPLISVPGTYVAIRFEDLLLLILGIFTAVKILTNLKTFLNDWIVKAFLIFFGVALVSLISGIFLTKTIGFRIGLLEYLRRVEYVVPFFACLAFLKKETILNDLVFYLKLFAFVVVAAFVYGFGQVHFHFPVIITQNAEYSRGIALFWSAGSQVNSTFAGHYDLAAFIVIVIPILITLLFVFRDWVNKLIFILVTGAGLWLLIASVSRIGQVAYIVAVSLSILLLRKYKEAVIIVLISAILIGMSSGVQTRFGRILDLVKQEFHISKILGSIQPNFVILADGPTSIPATPAPPPAPAAADRSTSIRLNVEWPRAIRAFEKNPLVGTGYSSITLATDNDYLRMLGEVGVLGFAAFFLVFLRIGQEISSVFPKVRNTSKIIGGFFAGIIGGLVGTFLIALFIDIFEASKFAIVFWLLIGIAVFLARNIDYVQEN